jgi:carbamoylphosphate synthase large subunit
MQRTYNYRGICSLANLRNVLQDCKPDIVIPCDDGVVLQLHALHASEPSLRPLIEHSLGSPENYSLIEGRHRFLSVAAELGIRVPRMKNMENSEDLVAWHAENSFTSVLKIDGGSGGNGVRITRSIDESLAAWRELRAPVNKTTAWKRLVIDRDPLALWMQRRQSSREMTIQEYIPGRPANSMLVCWRGKLLSSVSVAVVAAEGLTGASTIVRVIQNDEMKKVAKLIVERLNLSGFCGLDFVLESGSGTPFLIEMNPRCTQLGHMELEGDGCLAGVLSAVLRGEPQPKAQNPIREKRIALFPQSVAAGDACRPFVRNSFLDAPTEPTLLSELSKKSWPERRWLARLYHSFKPLKQSDPVLFEDLEVDPA